MIVAAIFVAASTLDAVTGPDVSMLLLYSTVTAIAGWFGGRRAALGLAAASSTATALVQLLHPDGVTSPGIVVLNASLRAVSLAFLGFVVVHQKRLIGTLRASSVTDAMTGVLNRAGTMQHLHHEIERARRLGRPLSVAYLDLDGLKICNDRHGHRAGDELITRLMTVTKSTIRSIDAIGRLGGDEFVIVFGDTDASSARHMIDRLSRSPELPAVSIGVICYETIPAGIDADGMIQRVDEVMYCAKHSNSGPIIIDNSSTPPTTV